MVALCWTLGVHFLASSLHQFLGIILLSPCLRRKETDVPQHLCMAQTSTLSENPVRAHCIHPTENPGQLWGSLSVSSGIAWAFTFSAATGPNKQAYVLKGCRIRMKCTVLSFSPESVVLHPLSGHFLCWEKAHDLEKGGWQGIAELLPQG